MILHFLLFLAVFFIVGIAISVIFVFAVVSALDLGDGCEVHKHEKTEYDGDEKMD